MSSRGGAPLVPDEAIWITDTKDRMPQSLATLCGPKGRRAGRRPFICIHREIILSSLSRIDIDILFIGEYFEELHVRIPINSTSGPICTNLVFNGIITKRIGATHRIAIAKAWPFTVFA
jgi:hypothetical protein